MKTKERLDIIEFGEQLLRTEDLDPIYCMLWASHLREDKEQLRRWLLAYWCFYHAGTSSWIVDQKDYWKAMAVAAGSKDYSRSPERRHFRGRAAQDSVRYLHERGVDGLFSDLDVYDVGAVMEAAGEWTGFGPWISFKIADMLERLGIAPIEFDGGEMFLFDSPREAADLLYQNYFFRAPKTAQEANKWAVDTLLSSELSEFLAPPRFERPINVQEVETILCKWKSHWNGRYHVGEDIESMRAALTKYRETSSTARRLLAVSNDYFFGRDER